MSGHTPWSKIKKSSTRKYGWRPDLPDARDHFCNLTHPERMLTLPASASLRANMPPVYDQLELGSCTANATAGAVQYQQMKQGEAEGQNVPSRLFIYYNERKLEGTVGWDSGAQLRDGIRVMATLGAPPESDWPYVISKYTTKPPAQSYTDAAKYTALNYAHPMRTSYYLRNVVAAGHTCVFGFTVYESFESQATANDGIVTMPEPGEQILGGHAVLFCGYKLINGHLYFEVRNSWGDGWGDNGYCWFPLAYLLDTSLSSDFWVIRLMS